MKNTFKTTFALAAAGLVAAGGFYGYQSLNSNEISSVVSLDVNPSLELNLDDDNIVKGYNALNDDAKTVIGDMKLEGVDVDLAMNALIGSMLKNGYLNDITNSLLISVESNDDKVEEALSKKLTADVTEILSGSGFSAAVIGQIADEAAEEIIEEIAEANNISKAKAQLVKELSEKDDKYSASELSALSITELGLIDDDIIPNGNVSENAYIGTQKATEIATSHANTPNAIIEETDIDFENGKMVYEIEFSIDGIEYDYTVDAITGEVIEFDNEIDDHIDLDDDDDMYDDLDDNDDDDNISTQNIMSQSSATNIAFSHAGVSGKVTDIELDNDDDRAVYEIKFYANGTEYEYEIDAVSGSVLKSDIEVDDDFDDMYDDDDDMYDDDDDMYDDDDDMYDDNDDDDDDDNINTQNIMSQSSATNIAFSHAGVSGKVTDIELDEDDGRAVYEIKFYANGAEYEYEIDAVSGSVLKSDVEVDDDFDDDNDDDDNDDDDDRDDD